MLASTSIECAVSWFMKWRKRIRTGIDNVVLNVPTTSIGA